jgi:hypothetical protein
MGGKPRAARTELATTALLADEIEALSGMSVTDLRGRYVEFYGRPATTHNRDYLRKRVAWKIQERTEGGLSPRALERIEQLAPLAPVRWQAPVAPTKGNAAPIRDPRLPAVGTALTRQHGGKDHDVRVLADGFEYQGRRYRSLSKIAREITGTAWNGYLFFFGRANGTRNAG